METTYENLNAELFLTDEDGNIQFDKDHEAARAYHIEHVNAHTRFFHSLREKTDYLLEQSLWKEETVNTFSFDQFKALFKRAYSYKFRFKSFMGARKFYEQYALRDLDGETIVERFEDRVVMCAIDLSAGDYQEANDLVDAIITGRFQPATPTFLNAGRAQGGERVSCFLLRVDDNTESITRSFTSAAQLSRRGGGVGLNITNIRESGANVRKTPGAGKGLVPPMKVYEDTFKYFDQLGQRQGAGAVYVNAHHPDIMQVLDTKRENADEAIRIKTLSIGVIIPDITFDLARRNADMYLFSPYDVKRVTGKDLSDQSVTEHYQEWVEDDRITKRKINARQFFQTLSELQFESGYPYVMFEDTVNRAHPLKNAGRVQQSNLCVAPETMVLTDKGYERIEDIAETSVYAWNGEEFSESYVAKTGEDQPLITVDFNNGASLDVTPYHKFYVKSGYGNRKVVETRATDLKPGDMLEKFDLPVIDDPDAADFPHAYTAGLHSADGTYTKDGTAILRLYPGKTHLGDYIEYRSSSLVPDSTGRVSYILGDDVPAKYVVPSNCSLKSRLDWLAGLIDGDGWGNGRSGIQIASIHPTFLEDVRMMLTTLGVESKWTKVRDAGKTQFKPDQKFYDTKTAYRLVISGTESQKLRRLGLPTHRVIIEEYDHQRAANGYIKVESVTDEGRVADTYCLNEPKIHKVVFNGIRTGNCSEILQFQTPSVFNPDNSYAVEGHDISCNLGSLNIGKMLELTNDEFTDTVIVAVNALDQVSRSTSIESVPSVRRGNEDTHSIGLGMMNLHGALGERHIYYDSDEARDLFDRFCARVTYSAMLASMNLAKKYGPHQFFTGSEYDTGEWFRRVVDPKIEEFGDNLAIYGELTAPTAGEWAELEKEVKTWGMANGYIQAVPPTGSISYINNSTSSIHPVMAPIEIRKEAKTGRTYYPAPGMNNDNLECFQSAAEIGPEATIKMYATGQHWIDQGMSLTLAFPDKVKDKKTGELRRTTTRDIDRARIFAWTHGIKTLYYIRLRQAAMEGTAVPGTAMERIQVAQDEAEGCVSCAL